MADDDGKLIALIATCGSACKIAMDLFGAPSGESKMVATIPDEYVIAALAIAIGVAIFVSFCTLLWRWVEHNDAHGIKDRTENPLKIKFVGGTLLAALATAVVGFFGCGVLAKYFGIAEPNLVDYVIFIVILDLFFGIALSIIFNEGITAFGKFVKQGAEKAKDAAKDVASAVTAEDVQKFMALINAMNSAAGKEEPAAGPFAAPKKEE